MVWAFVLWLCHMYKKFQQSSQHCYTTRMFYHTEIWTRTGPSKRQKRYGSKSSLRSIHLQVKLAEENKTTRRSQDCFSREKKIRPVTKTLKKKKMGKGDLESRSRSSADREFECTEEHATARELHKTEDLWDTLSVRTFHWCLRSQHCQ